MRKALIVGINDYSFAPLNGCIPDAEKMVNILSKDAYSNPNFDCGEPLISSKRKIDIPVLKERIEKLFSAKTEVALFYFSGHGTEATSKNRACLVTQDARTYDEGVELDYLMEKANTSMATEVIIILDCCYSGAVGNSTLLQNITTLREGVSILASSHQSGVSIETSGAGLFTSIIYDALNGGAADTLGLTTVASVYSFADKLLGAWDQRPIFKSYVTKMITLRKCKPLVELNVLRNLPDYFPTADHDFPLDPTFEPDAEPKGHDNEKVFADLQKYNRASLLIPIGEDHMYFAAINKKSCVLTPLGKYYWKLAKEGKL